MLAPLTASRALTGWSVDPVTAALVGACALAYTLGIRRTPAWPRVRTAVFFVGGLGSWMFATMSFLGTYDTTLFWPRAVQTVVLLMVTPLFLAVGMPVTLALRALPPGLAERLRRIGRGRVARVLAFPAVVSAFLLATPFVVFLTPVFDAVLRGGWADALLKLWLVAVGFAYYWTRLQVDPVPKVYPALVSIWITFAEVMFDGGLGLILILSGHPVGAGHYAAVRSWGPSTHVDQQMGGAAIWIIGDLSGLPFLGALFRRMVAEDAVATARIDRELDARDAARAAATRMVAHVASARLPADDRAGTVGRSNDSGVDDGMEAPWWETMR